MSTVKPSHHGIPKGTWTHQSIAVPKTVSTMILIPGMEKKETHKEGIGKSTARSVLESGDCGVQSFRGRKTVISTRDKSLTIVRLFRRLSE